MDQKFSIGLANTPTNVFKLTDGKGISWVWFSCPCAAPVDHPKDNPVLSSYATLLANGYVCAWKNSMGSPESGTTPDMASPITPADPSQAHDQAERKELWLFHLEKMPQVQHLMSPRLKRVGCGTWKEGVPPDQTVYSLLFQALKNVIERSLISKSFYSLGHWFAKPEMDTSDRLCMMCNFTFFLHAHEVICASVDVKTMVGLAPLTLELLNQAMTSKSGLKVLLSPSGLSATLTGHSYSLSDDTVREMMDEWKIFYPKKHPSDHNYDMPAAVEVVIGGVRMKYPSHFILVMGTPPDDASVSLDNTHSNFAVDQMLSHWPSSDLAEAPSINKICNCRMVQKTIQQSLRLEKVHLSEMRLPSKRSKEESSTLNTSKETADSLPHLKLAKVEDFVDTPGYSSVMGQTSCTRLGNSSIPKYATPLPSPSVSMPGSPTTTQLPTPRVQVLTSSLDEDTTHTKYDYELATSQMKTDAMEWNSGLEGWWQCLSLPIASAVPSEPINERCLTSVIPKPNVMSTVLKPSVVIAGTTHALPLPHATTTPLPSLEPENCDEKQPLPPASSVGTGGSLTDVETTGETRAHNTDNYMSSDLLKVPMSLESIFDEDDIEQRHYVSGDASVKDTKRGAPSKDSLPDLQRMFPTPPSVEPLCTVEDKLDELHTDVAEGTACKGDTTDVPFSDDEQHYTPQAFAPIQALPSTQIFMPRCCQYSPPYKNTTGGITGSNNAAMAPRLLSQEADNLSTSVDNPQSQGKFQFPPSPSLMTSLEDRRVPPNKKRPESLSLSLSLRPPLTSSNGVTPLLSPALRTSRQSSFYHHLSSRTTTPRDSPSVVSSELPTPTPAISNKLLPALPEAHALFLTLTLVHCLEPLEDVPCSPNLLQTTGGCFGGRAASGKCGLGFMEDSQNIYSDMDQQVEWMGSSGATQTGYASINDTKTVSSVLDLPETLLRLVQDISMQLTFRNMDLAAWEQQPNPTALSFTSKCCMYPEKVFVSALCQSQFLIGQIRSQGYGPIGRQPTSFKPSTESNAGEWVKLLQTVCGPAMIRHMRSIKNALLNLVNSSTLKVAAEGPLNLRDMQQLASSQTVLGNECSPIPLPPLVVGYEHEWMSVSPLCLPHWDSMMFEPYSCKKDLLYMVFVPESQKLVSSTQAYFKEMSVMYESCNLGRHIPVTFKDVCDQGVIPIAMQSDFPDSPHPTFATGIQKYFLDSLVPALECVTEEPTDLLSVFTNGEHAAMPSTMSTMYPLPSTHIQRLCGIILYLVMDHTTLKYELCQTMKALDEALLHKDIPEYIRRLLMPQIFIADSICGFHMQSYNEEEMRTQAYGVYSGCRVFPNLCNDVHSLTSFGPGVDRHALVDPSNANRYYAPLFVLTPEQLTAAQPAMVLGGASWLLSNEEEVLFCSYCVSSSKKWLLATCSNKHGEILNTSVIEIHAANKSYFCSSRSLALQKLWRYCMSVVCGSILRWSVVITRVGNAGWEEIAEWSDVIVNDGLLTANQHLREQCTACQETSRHPELVNVVISSVQPDSTFRLLCTQETLYSFSHGMVLPPNPAAANLLSPQEAEGDFVSIFSGVEAFSGSEDLDPSLMKSLEWDWPEANDPPASAVTHTIDQPLATGYLISPDTIGNMPEQFWEGGCQQYTGEASVLKLMLHWQFADIRHDSNSPQETLGSILLCLDALAWLNVDSGTGRRRSCLPFHIRVLMNLFQLLHVIDTSKQ